jgi:hypothetical protein
MQNIPVQPLLAPESLPQCRRLSLVLFWNKLEPFPYTTDRSQRSLLNQFSSAYIPEMDKLYLTFVFLLVVNHLHVPILLDPQLAYDDVVNAAGGVSPGVGLVVPEQPGPRESTHVSIEMGPGRNPP